jgi:two-component system LytT family response regulator
MLRVVVVDDEPLAIRALQRLLAARPDVSVVGTADNLESAIQVIRSELPDAVFLDVDLGTANGFDLLTRVQPAPRIIFVTGSPQHAVAAFAVEATDYLLKPVIADRLDESLKRLRRSPAPKPEGAAQMVELKLPNRSVFVEATTISALVAEDDFTRVHLAGQRDLLILRTLSHFETVLPAGMFLRISRSIIVNLDQIRRHESPTRDTSFVTLDRLPSPIRLGRTATIRLKKALKDRARDQA